MVIGRSLRYAETPEEAARRHLVEHGFPESLAGAMLTPQAASARHEAFTTGEVETILGHPALIYAEWDTDHAGAFRGP
jgi:hypothetical protein